MIAVVSSGHKPDDERIYYKEIRSLLRAGYEIQYFTRSNSEICLSEKNLKHFNVSPIKYYINKYINYVAENIDNEAVILHIHEFDLLQLAKKLKKRGEIKAIYDVHDTLRAMWETFSSKKGLLKKVINKSLSFYEASHLVYVDEVILANKIFVQNFYAEKGLSTTVVENYPQYKNIGEIKNQSDTPLILYQGQIGADRGLTVLVDAFDIVIKEIPGAHMKIVGAIRSKIFEKTIKEKIYHSNYSSAIELLKETHHHNIWNYMRDAQIGIIPSLRTPRVKVDTPTKLFEYMASGCVVIATDLPPVHYFLEDIGELVKPGSAQELANAILKILNDEDLLKKYSSEGLRIIKEKYNWNFAERKLIDLYQRVST